MKRKILPFLALFVFAFALPHVEARKARTTAKTSAHVCHGCCSIPNIYTVAGNPRELSETAQTIRARIQMGVPTDLELRKPWLKF